MAIFRHEIEGVLKKRHPRVFLSGIHEWIPVRTAHGRARRKCGGPAYDRGNDEMKGIIVWSIGSVYALLADRAFCVRPCVDHGSKDLPCAWPREAGFQAWRRRERRHEQWLQPAHALHRLT